MIMSTVRHTTAHINTQATTLKLRASQCPRAVLHRATGPTAAPQLQIQRGQSDICVSQTEESIRTETACSTHSELKISLTDFRIRRGGCLTTFQGSLSVPFSRVSQSKNFNCLT